MALQVPVNAPAQLIQAEGGTVVAVKKLTAGKAGAAKIAVPSATVVIPSSMTDTTGSSLLETSDCAEVSTSVTAWSNGSNPYSYETTEILLSRMTGVGMYCSSSKQTVANLQSGNEFEVCMKLTSATSGAKCMHHLAEGGYSDVGVTTVGVSTNTDWPQPKNASDDICCKATHLSDFVVVEGLYIEDWMPARDAVSVSKHSHIELTFNLPIELGSGNVTLTPVDGQGDNTPLQIDVNDGTQVSVDGAKLVIDMSHLPYCPCVGWSCPVCNTSELDDRADKEYRITLPPTAIRGLVNKHTHFGFNGSFYSFALEDTTGPKVVSLYPSHETRFAVVDTQIRMLFYETVAMTHNITLTPAGGAPIRTQSGAFETTEHMFTHQSVATRQLSVGDSQVNVTGELVTISLSKPLAPGISWTVSLENNTIHDTQSPSNPIDAFSWVFTTECSNNCSGNGVCTHPKPQERSLSSAASLSTAWDNLLTQHHLPLSSSSLIQPDPTPGVYRCECNLGYSGRDCSTVEDVSLLRVLSFTISRAPSKICQGDSFTATINAENFPKNLNGSSTIAHFEATIVNADTQEMVYHMNTSTGASWRLLAPSLPNGTYIVSVRAEDPLNRGINYGVTQRHTLEVTPYAVVPLSASPLSISTYRPLEVALLAEVKDSACVSDPQIVYLWVLTDQATGNTVALPDGVRTQIPHLVLPPDTLQPGSSYRATVIANYTGNASLCDTTSSGSGSGSSSGSSSGSGSGSGSGAVIGVSIASSVCQPVDITQSGAHASVDIVVGRSPILARFRQGIDLTTNLPLALDIDAVDPDAASDAFTYSWNITEVRVQCALPKEV